MTVAELQNEPAHLRLLAAQRNLYSESKRIIGLQMLLAGPVAIGATVAGLLIPEIKNTITIWGLTVIFIELVVLLPAQKKMRESAAKIQELFDCQVLSLPWNELKAGKKPDPEVVHAHAKKFAAAESMEVLRDWYPPAAATMPNEIARVICQRANVYWDSKLRRRYAWALAAAAFIVTLGLVWLSAHTETRLQDFVVFLLSPMASTYALAYRQFTEHREAAERLDRLKDHANKLFNEVIGGMSADAARAESRALQDEIFDGRKRNPPIFDFIFKMFHRENEDEMNTAADTLVMEAAAAQGRMAKPMSETGRS